MKNKMLVVFSIILAFFVFSTIKSSGYSVPPYAGLAHKLMQEVQQDLEQMYQLVPSGISEGMMGCVQFVGLSFYSDQQLSLDESRQIVMQCSHHLLNKINESQEIHKYLEVYPFTAKNVAVSIYFQDVNGEEPLYPYVCASSLYRGNLLYFTKRKIGSELTLSEHEESYQEALSILNKEKSDKPLGVT